MRAIRTAHAGEAPLSPAVAARVVEEIAHGGDRTPQVDELTPRELEVLRLIAGGRSNKRIALELGVAEKTVKTHVSHVLAKLGLSDRTQAALYAVREGLVGPRGPRPNSRWWRGRVRAYACVSHAHRHRHRRLPRPRPRPLHEPSPSAAGGS